jgi:RNA polymerase sigma-70 factor (ECF subfamily)
MTRLVEDRQLLEAFRRGERAALAEVYREYVRPLYAMISTGFSFESGGHHHHFAGHREPWAVENTVQEVFARAFMRSARERYDGVRPYRNYLFTIARNLVVDALRARQEETLSDGADLGAHGSAPPRSPEDDLVEKQIESRCDEFVAALAVEERRLFEARFREGLSVEETARRLAISEHRVKSGERRLKKRFFARMKECGYFEGYRLHKTGIESVALVLLMLFARGRTWA